MSRAAAWLTVWAALILQWASVQLLGLAHWLHFKQARYTYARALRSAVEAHGETIESAAQSVAFAMRTHLGPSSEWFEKPDELRECPPEYAAQFERKQRLHELGLCCGCEARLEPSEFEIGLCLACDLSRDVGEPPP